MPARAEGSNLLRRGRILYGLSSALLITLAACRPAPAPIETSQPTLTPQLATEPITIPISPTPEPQKLFTPAPLNTPTPKLEPTSTPKPEKIKAEDIPEIATAIAEGILPTRKPVIVYSAQTPTPVVLAHAAEGGRSIDSPIQSNELSDSSIENARVDSRKTIDIFIPSGAEIGRPLLSDDKGNLFFLSPDEKPSMLNPKTNSSWSSERKGRLIDVDGAKYANPSLFAQLYSFDNSTNTFFALDKKTGKTNWEIKLTEKPDIVLPLEKYLIINYRKDNKPYYFLLVDKATGKFTKQDGNADGVWGSSVFTNNKLIDIRDNRVILSIENQTVPTLLYYIPRMLFLDKRATIRPTLSLVDFNGKTLFETQTDLNGAIQDIWITEDRVYLKVINPPQSAKFAAINKQTKKVWYWEIGNDLDAQVVEVNSLVIGNSPNKKKLLGFDAQSGNKKWENNSFQPQDLVRSDGPFATRRGAFMQYSAYNPKTRPTQLLGLDLQNGQKTWNYEAKEQIKFGVSFKEFYVFVQGDKLVFLDPENGKIKILPAPSVTNLVASDDSLAILTGTPNNKGLLNLVTLS